MNLVVDSVGASGMKDEDVQRLAGRRLPDRPVQLAEVVHARGGQLPHPPQDPRRRRRDRLHRRRRRRRSLARARAGQGSLARHAGPHARSDRAARSRRPSTRTSSKRPATVTPELDDRRGELHERRRTRSCCAARRPAAATISSGSICSRSRPRAARIDITIAVLRHRRIERLVVAATR